MEILSYNETTTKGFKVDNDIDYVTPLVGQIAGGICAIAIAYVGTKLATRYLDKRFKVLETK
jgi:hypothetical protein